MNAASAEEPLARAPDASVAAIVMFDGGVTTGGAESPPMTSRVAVDVSAPTVPRTVCVPAMLADHVAPTQLPPGEIVNTVLAVTAPMAWSNTSSACAVYTWLPPAGIVAVAGPIAM